MKNAFKKWGKKRGIKFRVKKQNQITWVKKDKKTK